MIRRWTFWLWLWVIFSSWVVVDLAQAATITITMPDQRLRDEVERACISRLPCGPGTIEERLRKFVDLLIHVGSSFYGAPYKNLSDVEGTLTVEWKTP